MTEISARSLVKENERKHSCEAQKLYGDGSVSVLLENQKLQTFSVSAADSAERLKHEET